MGWAEACRGGHRRATLTALVVAALLAGCAGPGGPGGVMTGEALDSPAIQGAGTSAVVAQELPAVGQPVAAQATTAPAAAAPAVAPDVIPTPSAAAPRAHSESGSRAAPPPQSAGKPKELTYPSFGTPKQIGDMPVMDKEQTKQLQTDLETLAKERESKQLRELEQDQP